MLLIINVSKNKGENYYLNKGENREVTKYAQNVHIFSIKAVCRDTSEMTSNNDMKFNKR